MPKVVPSQVVELIDKMFSWAASDQSAKDGTFLEYPHAAFIAPIVELVNQIPPELITIQGDDYVALVVSSEILRTAINMWPERGPTYKLGPGTPGFGHIHPVALLRSKLSLCADQAAKHRTTDLLFIRDKAFRNSLRLDLSSAHQSLNNGEWKAATVLAGSVVEALLLWALKNRFSSTQRRTAAVALVGSGVLGSLPDNNILRWELHPLIEVAHHLNVISDRTTSQCRIAKDYRNLIHPGKTERMQIRCSRSTAHSAIAAMEHVAEDLS